MFVWHRQGIFSKWHTVVVLFYPRKISLNIAYLCSDQAWLNFSHLFLVLLGLLTHTLLGNIWIEPQPPYPPNLDHIPSLCSTLRKCEQHRKMWLFVTQQAGWCLISHEAELVGVFIGRDFEGVGGIMGKQMLWIHCALRGTYGHSHRGSVWHVLESKVMY